MSTYFYSRCEKRQKVGCVCGKVALQNFWPCCGMYWENHVTLWLRKNEGFVQCILVTDILCYKYSLQVWVPWSIYAWASKVLASERRPYIYNIVSHWLRPCSAIDELQTIYIYVVFPHWLSPCATKDRKQALYIYILAAYAFFLNENLVV